MAEDPSSQVESAIINNQPDVLESLLKNVDVNMCLNTRNDSALFLAVKLSHRSIVKTLLSSPNCNLAHQNINYYSPLDLALVMVYDNQKEPRQSACWDILEMLLEAGAEPACSFAMLYVIRTALKLSDDQFIFHLIQTLIHYSNSLELHALFLWKLHRNQPLYTGFNSDEFFERALDFTIKLIKWHGKHALNNIVTCFSYYSDSRWDSRGRKDSLMIKLVIYVTACGWKWQHSTDFAALASISPTLEYWCHKMSSSVHSLTHLSRLSLLSSPKLQQYLTSKTIPNRLLNYLNFNDIDVVMSLMPNLKYVDIKF